MHVKSFPDLSVGTVHVWRVNLKCHAKDRATYLTLLSPDEVDRAERFVFDIHRDRYIVGRGVLRQLLCRYLNVQPKALTFAYGDKGKPYIDAPSTSLHFNVSHTANLGLLAFAYRRLGVDIEQINPDRATTAIAERYFAPDEVSRFKALPESERSAGFYNAWTRKEAYMKAVGAGLALGLANFSVTLSPNVPARLLATRWQPDDAANWSMTALSPYPDSAAALVVSGHDWHLDTFSYMHPMGINFNTGS